jgi:O-antigen/teichoic acid export membrane protein
MLAKKQFGNAMILYAIGTFLQRIGAFILVPLYTSVLLIPEYGALETITVTFQVFMILINFGLSNALIRFYHECQGDDEVFQMIRSSWVSVIGISILMCLVVSPFFHSISSILFRVDQFGELLTLTFFWAIGGALNQQYFAYYRARQQARTYIIVSILYFIVSTTLNIWFVRYLNMKVAGVLYGNLAVVWGINLIAFIKFFGRDRSLSFQWMKKLFGFGFPLLFGIISWLILNSADRYFLAYYRDLSEVAIYGLGYKVGLIAQIAVVTPFQLAWAPYMFNMSLSSSKDVREEFSRIFTYLLTGFCFVGVGIFLFSKEIVFLLGSGKYSQAAEVIPYVLVAYLFSGVFYWAGSFLNLTNKTFVYSIISVLMAILNLLLNWLWIPVYGWHGAAWATVITISGTGILTLIAGEWVFPIKLQYSRIMKLFLSVGIITFVRSLIYKPTTALNICMSLGLWISLPLLLILVGFFEPFETRSALAFLNQAKQKILKSHR